MTSSDRPGEAAIGVEQGDFFATAGEIAASAVTARASARSVSATPRLPSGWRYQEAFISAAEEADLLGAIAALPLHAARYKAYTARRRVASFGTEYDFHSNRLLPGEPVPQFLLPLRRKCAGWLGVEDEALSSALVAEYSPGTPLGWHRDVPDFESVVGVSLATPCRMRMRPYPPLQPKKADLITVELAPRSAYVLQGPARWAWQHSITPTPALRYSVTFRTRRAGGR